MGVDTAYDFTKDPSDVLNYSFDWSRWLIGDTIVSFTPTATAGLIINSQSFTPTQTTVILSGGTAGLPYTVTHEITTAAGLVKNLTMSFRVTTK